MVEGQPLGAGGSGRSESAYERQVLWKLSWFSSCGAIRCNVAWQPWLMAPSRNERVAKTDSERLRSYSARAAGARRLLLGVYSRNAPALAFYARCGFVRAGERTFRVGGSDYHDYLLSLAL